jgi:hypothetical protein
LYFQIIVFFLAITNAFSQNNQYRYYQDIYPIVANKCFKCHNNEENAPFRLLTYNDIASKKEIIKKVINEHIMPPVIIDTTFKNFGNVILLSNKEREKILQWIDNGLIVGNLIYVDSNKVDKRNNNDKIKVSLDRNHNLGNTPKDQYLFSIINLPIKDSIVISNYDFVIKDKYLHHAELLDLDTSSKNIDEANLLIEEYELNRNRPDVKINRYLLGWFPGSTAGIFPKNTGMKLYGNRKYMLIMHYSPTLESHKDRSYINLFKENDDYREVLEYALYGTRRHIVENRGQPFIKKDEVKTFHYTDVVEYDMSMFAVYFHAHHLCENMYAYAVTPNLDTIKLLKIDDWNFNWQFTYRLNKYEKIPKGSVIHCHATYDNTINNIENPNNPPKDVNASFYSEDEMLEFFILHLKYKTNDENSKIDYN